MIMKYIASLLGCFILSSTQIIVAQTVIPLYEGKAPGSYTWDWQEAAVMMGKNTIAYNVLTPTLTYYPAPKEKANGTAVIVAPGGAFHILSINSEGTEVAKWLNERGIAAFVLKYRLVKSVTNNPFEELMPLMNDFKKLDSINAPVVEMATADGIQAMKYVRSHAISMQINPAKIGFMGFSAGGTVTMSVTLSAPKEWKPNFVAPIYLYNNAVIGNEMPSKETPIFIAVASDDQLKFVPHSIKVYETWFASGHEAELHIYEKGGHGFGMNQQQTSSDNWILDFDNWLIRRGLIKK